MLLVAAHQVYSSCCPLVIQSAHGCLSALKYFVLQYTAQTLTVCCLFLLVQAQDMLRNLILGAIVLYWLMGLVSMAAALSPASNKTLWGATAVAVLGVYYVAPLSSVAKVIAERDSSSLHWPLCTMNIINGMLWFAYGLALKDWFVCLPVSVMQPRGWGQGVRLQTQCTSAAESLPAGATCLPDLWMLHCMCCALVLQPPYQRQPSSATYDSTVRLTCWHVRRCACCRTALALASM